MKGWSEFAEVVATGLWPVHFGGATFRLGETVHRAVATVARYGFDAWLGQVDRSPGRGPADL